MKQEPPTITDFSHSESLYESQNTAMNYIFDMAVNCDDLMVDSEGVVGDFDKESRYGDKTQINSGGMKLIYQVHDHSTERDVAMACLRPDKILECQKRFLREARITASLEHPNIMPVYDIGVDAENNPYFTMKLTGGQNLAEMLNDKCLMLNDKTNKFLDVFVKVCDAVSYAHSRDIVHLDLKPHNIQIGAFGEVLVCDWGLGKVLSHSEFSNESFGSELPMEYWDLTLDGDIKGTPGFMAPEQVNIQMGDRDQRTDIYALGGILYYILTGNSPVRGTSLEDALERTTTGTIAAIDSSVPPALKAVVHKALSKEPSQRYNNVEALKSDVDAYMNGFATIAEEASIARMLFLFIKRHKVVSAFLGLVVVLVVGFGVHLRMSEQHARELLKLYEGEKEKTIELQRDALPALLKKARSALSGFRYAEYEKMLKKAMRYAPDNIDIIQLRGELLFYLQKFNEAAEIFRTNQALKDHPLHRFCREFGELKADEARLSHVQFNALVKSLDTYRYQRQLVGYERQRYESLEHFIETIRIFYQDLNPKQKSLRCVLTCEGEKNRLDLSGNPRLNELHISSLSGLPLQAINLEGLRVSNYNARKLATMPLEEINLAGDHAPDLEFIYDMPTLKRLILRKGRYPDYTIKRLRKRLTVILK